MEDYRELAREAAEDRAAFEKLYRIFYPRVYNFIFARVKNRETADDLTAEVFMKMLAQSVFLWDSTLTCGQGHAAWHLSKKESSFIIGLHPHNDAQSKTKENPCLELYTLYGF